jgi:uncharacterized protein YgiM (DUF1202 family)
MRNGFFAAVTLFVCVGATWAVQESSTPTLPEVTTPAPAEASTPATPAAPIAPETPAAAPEAKPVEPIAAPQFPYIAEVIGTEVYVRSGAGTAYYHCGKLNAPQRVTVVASEANNWFKILPPPGSFSWISKNYVKVDAAQPTKGTVTGDAVRVWAGSDFVEPMRSSSMQTKLNQGAVLDILGNPAGEGDYYKIAPPAGAFLYVSGESLKPILPEVKNLGPAKDVAKVESPKTLAEVTVDVNSPAQPPMDPDKPIVAPRPAMEQVWLKECYAISAKLDEEVKKPAPEQKYDDYKKTLEPILADPNSAGIAIKYAEYLAGRIKRYETAIVTGDQLRQQEEKMADVRKQIDEARKAQLEKIAKQYEQYVMTGILKPSYVYSGSVTQKRYLLTNEQGRVIAYVVLGDATAEAAVENLFNKKVGLIGRVINSPKELITLVSASKIEELKE